MIFEDMLSKSKGGMSPLSGTDLAKMGMAKEESLVISNGIMHPLIHIEWGKKENMI